MHLHLRMRLTFKLSLSWVCLAFKLSWSGAVLHLRWALEVRMSLWCLLVGLMLLLLWSHRCLVWVIHSHGRTHRRYHMAHWWWRHVLLHGP